MSEADRERTVVGLRDGFGAAMGVFRSFAAKRISILPEETSRQGAQELTDDFQLFIRSLRLPSSQAELVSRVVARCERRPKQFAANSLVDVYMGLDTQ